MSPNREMAASFATACLGAVLAMLVAGLLVARPVAANAASTVGTRYAQVVQACQAPAPGDAGCLALVREPVARGAVAGARAYVLNDGAASSGPAGGLTPAQLASAYEYEPSTGGTGQTVGIVDAYDDPKIEEDLAQFDANYKLSSCTSANGCFEKVGQTGSTKALPAADAEGWSLEIALDVETVHAACPNCKIVLVEASSASYRNLATAVNEAVALGATEVSNSYGGPEEGIEASEQAAYEHPGVVIAAAAGDDGYDDWDLVNKGQKAVGMPDAPASLPSVVAVGGTSLRLNAEGRRAGETVWNNNGPGDELGLTGHVSGGGCSTRFAAQPWQLDAPGFGSSGCGGKRLTADIAAVADPYTGFDIYDSDVCGSYCKARGLGKGWATLGGTSLSTPLISALYALAGGGHGLSVPSLALYGHLAEPSPLYDVTEGANGFCGGEATSACGDPNATHGPVDCEGTTACNAATGFDGPSGVGAPRGLGAFEPALPHAAIAPPGSSQAGIPASFSASASSDPNPGGAIASYAWSWGDGSHGGGEAPSHTYAAPGKYEVSLTVTDGYGLTSTTSSLTIEVSAEDPAAKKKHEEEAAANKEQEEEARAKEVANEQKQREEMARKKSEEEGKAVTAAATQLVSPPAAHSSAQEVAGFQLAVASPIPDVQLVGTQLAESSSGTVVLRLRCPAGIGRCSGSIALRTRDAVSLGTVAGRKGKPATLALAKGSFAVSGGQMQALKARLSIPARTLLGRVRVLPVRMTIAAHDAAGASHTTRSIAVLHAAVGGRASHGG